MDFVEVFWPDPTKAFAASQIINGDVEAFVLGGHFGKANGGRYVFKRFSHKRLGSARFAGIVESQH